MNTAVYLPDEKIKVSGIRQLAGAPFRILSSLTFIDYRESLPTDNTKLLLSGEVDAALIPSIDFATYNDFFSLGYGMGCRGRSDSMILYSKDRLSDLHTIHIYNCSKSSLALMRMLLWERYQISPAIVRHSEFEPFQYITSGEGALGLHELPEMIRSEFPVAEDLAAMWNKTTRLPFVFLIWAIRKKTIITESIIKLQQWLHKASSIGEKVAIELSASYGTSPTTASIFIGQNRRYKLDPFLLSGLNQFWSKAHKYNLIPKPEYKTPTRSILSGFDIK